MKNLAKLFKSGLGLIYTTLLFLVIEFAFIWLTQYLIRLNWVGASLFWIFGIPLFVGIIQFIAGIIGVPIVYLMRGTRNLSWVLILPAVYCIFQLGKFLWLLASGIGSVLMWLLAITWFCETAWFFVAYLMMAIGSAFDSKK